ncbi:MAG: UvrD-helicase domain-containing protein, partial [Candidatus Aureabacteria bacterium]|nr:UvrD-helicase domain-containing protein [Candidatus Auribacterota bacterium]
MLQWRNLEAMVEEALSTGGSLFYVGDTKQAIYRFRGGEVGLFEQVAKEYARFAVYREILTHNRRSGRAIVEFNNDVFSMGNLARFIRTIQDADGEPQFDDETVDQLCAPFRGSRQIHEEGRPAGYVRAERVAADDEEAFRARLLAI